METLEPILREHPFLAGDVGGAPALHDRLRPQRALPGRRFLLARATEQRVLPDAGRPGSARVHVPGRGRRQVQTLGEGDMVGWSWLFPPYRWHFDARAVEPARALAFDCKCLRAKMRNDHELGYDLAKRFFRELSSAPGADPDATTRRLQVSPRGS